jgi:NAD(P)-dependent dehydrogenase (short-subunit alcohol dehydrogenase family)
MGQLEGKTAVVTGGTAGIGLAAAKRLAAESATVFITGRRKPELDAAVAEIGGSTVGVQGDVSDLADLDSLFQAVRSAGRRIDVLYANAGGGELATLKQVTEEHFDRTFAINVRGLLFTVQKALPLLNDGASVILPGSTTATTGTEAFGVYAASKAAVRSLGRTWAAELAPRGVRVNVITPGPIATPAIDRLASRLGQSREDFYAELASRLPLQRMGRPEEVAALAAFLAGPESSFITGAEHFVDGGQVQV